MYLDYLKGLLPCEQPQKTIDYYEHVLLLPKESERSFAVGLTGHMEVVPRSDACAVGPTAFWVEANQVDRTYAAVTAQGEANLLIELKDTYYGSREFQIVDPAGNITCVINYCKDLNDPERLACPDLYAKDEFRVVLYVKNLAACYRFYTEILGFKDVYSWEENRGDRGFKYELSPGSRSYIETLFREPLSVQKQGTVVLRHSDVQAEFARVCALAPEAVVRAFDGLQFTLQDPDGNYIIVEKG